MIVANALDGEGPFSPERSGGVPVGSVVDLCFSGNYTVYDIRKMLTGKRRSCFLLKYK